MIGAIITGVFWAVILCSYALAGESISINRSSIGGADGPTGIAVSDNINTSLDLAVSEAILAENAGKYIAGECRAEGHIIVGMESGSEEFTVYAVTSYGEYGFDGGRFVKTAGNSNVPAAITLRLREDGTYAVLDYREPESGMNYSDSVRALMPEESWDMIFTNAAVPALTRLEEHYAQAYLDRIGRDDVEIGL